MVSLLTRLGLGNGSREPLRLTADGRTNERVLGGDGGRSPGAAALVTKADGDARPEESAEEQGD
jgi:hypothetical protein